MKLTHHHAFAILAMTGRLSPPEAEKGAAMFEHDATPDAEPSSVREAMSELIGAASLATGRMRVNCPRCDGRGFYRGHKVAENEAIVVFCDDCDGQGTVLAELDA